VSWRGGARAAPAPDPTALSLPLTPFCPHTHHPPPPPPQKKQQRTQPYSLYDALRNPHADALLTFHSIGLDRLAYSPARPLVVTRRAQMSACAQAAAAAWPLVVDMDNITASVLVDTGGSLVMGPGLTFQGSRGQPRGARAWPGDLPLLLGAFQPVGSGRIGVRDSTLRVPSPRAVRELLDEMPAGEDGGIDSPDLAPVYGPEGGGGEEGGGGGSGRRRRQRRRLLQQPQQHRPPLRRQHVRRLAHGAPGRPGGGHPPGDESPFTIASWSIASGQWQRWVHGGVGESPAAAAGVGGGGGGNSALATWTFSDVRVERWGEMTGAGEGGGDGGGAGSNDRHCFHGPLTQASVAMDGVRRVRTGAELRDALRDATVRYVQVVDDVAWPSDDGGSGGPQQAQARIGRVVEVRACRDGDGGGGGRPFTIDWSRAPPGAVQVSGSLYFEGDLRMVRDYQGAFACARAARARARARER